MNEARILDQLQAIDLTIDALNHELAGVRGQVGESEELRAARARVEAARQRLHRLEADQRGLEGDCEDIAAKIKVEETKLYEGGRRSPRELSGIQREVEHLKVNRRALEDRLLDVMDQLEKTQAEVAAEEAALEAIVAEWRQAQSALAERQAELGDQLAERKQARTKVAAGVAAGVLATYENLRRNRGGRGVARIERNACQGCRITLPTSIVSHTRLGRELVYCPSCGRILVSDH